MNINEVPVFILAGGLGTRLSEETETKPKPMVQIGGIPILIHIMRYYYSFGFKHFVICAGYKSWAIKNYLMTYQARMSDLFLTTRSCEFIGKEKENWQVSIVDTGELTGTGGRIFKAWNSLPHLEKPSHFAVTYGDGLCDVDLRKEFAFHLGHQNIGTVLGVPRKPRFGEIKKKGDRVLQFSEKSDGKTLINGGFFFFHKSFLYFLSDDCILETKPLESLAKNNQLMVYEHQGFWECMDTLRDKMKLEEIWKSGPPWVK